MTATQYETFISTLHGWLQRTRQRSPTHNPKACGCPDCDQYRFILRAIGRLERVDVKEERSL